jgi:hypothetical protein
LRLVRSMLAMRSCGVGGRCVAVRGHGLPPHLASHRPSLRELVLRSGLVTALVLWAAVQLAPNFRGAALLNNGAIVLFVADLAFVLMPRRLTAP